MTVDEAIAAVGQEWRRMGVSAADRRVLAADLRLDLEAAVADGVAAGRVIEGDVRTFARRLAEESGVRHTPPRYGGLVAAGLAGALAGVLVGGLVMVGVYSGLKVFGLPGSFGAPLPVAAGVYYGAVGLAGLGGAVIGVLLLLRSVPAIGRTAAAIGWLTPLAALVVVPLVVLFARSTGYSIAAPIVLSEVAMSVAGFVAALVVARRWSLTRRSRS